MKQKEKKRIASKLFAALVVLTLISCCFVGTTFARYTSTGSGVASVEVATWDIDFTNSTNVVTDTTNVDFGMLSPSENSWETGSGVQQTNSTAHTYVAQITNNSDVDADISLSAATEATITLLTGDGHSYGDGYSLVADGLEGNGATEAQVKGLFSIALYYSYSKEVTGCSAYTTPVTLYADPTEGQHDTLYVYAVVTWTTAYSADDTSKGLVQDAIDTWVGQHVGSIQWTINYTAVQSSEQPV